MSDQLRRAEAALTAFGGDDHQPEELLGALLEREGIIGHPPGLIVRGVMQYAIAAVDQPAADRVTDAGEAVDPSGEQTAGEATGLDLDREERIERQYADVAGQMIGALMFRAGLMSVTDPMDVLSQAHQAFEAMRTERDEL